MSAMSEYLSPADLGVDAVADALTAHFDEVRNGRERRVDRTYYDTFDGLLHRAGLTLSAQAGALALAERDSGAVRARETTAPPRFAFELEPGPMRDALSPIIDVRALLPLVRVRTRELPLDVLDDERKTVVRLALDEPSVVKPARALRARLRVEPVRGYGAELERAVTTLERELGCSAPDEPLVDEAVRAAGGVVGGVSSKPNVELERDQSAGSAAAAVLRALLRVIEANYDGTVGDVDSEFLHDLRVAVRRTRAVQRELRQVFAPDELAHFRAEFRWLQQVTGDARDLDVYVLEFDQFRALVPEDMRADLEPVLEILRERRRVARRKMVRALRSARAKRLLDEWSTFVDSLSSAAPPIAELAGRRIRKVYRRMVRMGEAIDGSSPAEDYHELRKKGKELRYLLELFGAPLYPREVVAPMVKALKGLQDVLGRHQDREVQMAMLRSLSEELATRSDGAGALMAMGALVARLEDDERAARGGIHRELRRVRVEEAARAGQGHVRVSRVLATYNIKGGVGKTSAAVNLAFLAARDGAQTLLWDLDPQGGSTYLFRVKPKVRGGARKLVRGKSDVESLIKGTDHPGLDLLPADFSYRHMDLVLDEFKRSTRRLARVLEPLREEYEYIFLDCPPSISLVSESVFEAADALLVPIVPATLSARTFEQLQAVVDGDGTTRARLLLDGRPPAKAPPRGGRAAARRAARPAARGRDPALRRHRADGLPARGRGARPAPRGRAALAYEALWSDVRARLGA